MKQEYDLRDPEKIRKAVQHSNLVINCVGADYETRYYSTTTRTILQLEFFIMISLSLLLSKIETLASMTLTLRALA